MESMLTEFEESLSFDIDDPDFAPTNPSAIAHSVLRYVQFPDKMKPNSSSRNDATEKMLRRREWKLEQERQRQHERLKQKKIYEYEMQRAREKGLLPPKLPNRSKSRSKSPRSRPRRPCTCSTTNTPILSERMEFADETVPLFKGPVGTKISTAELRKIKVDIRRNIPGKSSDSDLQRNIINPEDVLVKRRAGKLLFPL